MHEVLVDRLGDRSLPRKSVARLTDHPDMTLDVYRGRKATTQQQLLFRVVLTHLYKITSSYLFHKNTTENGMLCEL